jgi:hypothetical protein
MDRTENHSSNIIFFCWVCIRSRGNIFTEPMPSNDSEKHSHTDWWEGLTKYVVEMGLGATLYMPNFVKAGSDIQKVIRGFIHSTVIS